MRCRALHDSRDVPFTVARMGEFVGAEVTGRKLARSPQNALTTWIVWR